MNSDETYMHRSIMNSSKTFNVNEIVKLYQEMVVIYRSTSKWYGAKHYPEKS